jgi:hypothetical protein
MRYILELFTPIGLTRLIYVTLIICSAAVTAYFGKVMGGDFILIPEFPLLFIDLPALSMGFFTAAGFFAISVCSAVFAYHAGYMRSQGQAEWRLVAQFALFLLACDIFTNYISWTTIRSQKIVVSSNQNTLADDVRQRIAMLRTTDADLTSVISAPGAWIAVKDAEKALEDTLAARAREADRLRCGPKCEELDLKARDLRIEIAKSRTRENAIQEREQVRKQLAKAEAKTEVVQAVIDPTNAQNVELASSFAGMNPSDKALFFAAKAIGLIGAIMFSLGASACGILLGLLTGRATPIMHNDQSHYAPPLRLQAETIDREQAARDREANMRVYRETTTIERQKEQTKNRLEEDLQSWAERFEQRARQMRSA